MKRFPNDSFRQNYGASKIGYLAAASLSILPTLNHIPPTNGPTSEMTDNTYFLYAATMLLLLAFGASAIAGMNFLLSVAKNFAIRDWRYRRLVLILALIVVALMLVVVIHWLSTPPS
jgi:hypothetical protein